MASGAHSHCGTITLRAAPGTLRSGSGALRCEGVADEGPTGAGAVGAGGSRVPSRSTE
jgi:hypothetical protein